MSMPEARSLVWHGETWGTIYTFLKAGDVLPAHVHEDEASNHITMVLFGEGEFFGHEDNDGVKIFAKEGGEIKGWPLGKPHGFRALTDGFTIANLTKVRT